MEFFKKSLEEKISDKTLEQQVERGNLFVHSTFSKHSARIAEIESFLYAIIDILIQKGLTPPDELMEAVKKVREEMRIKKEPIGVGISLRLDRNDKKGIEFVPVNCEDRLHICKAVCCKLSFPLSAEEVETGKIKWDLGQPYTIRQDTKTCYCTHLKNENLKCNIYDNRPSVCKKYSCANDERIWKNFEKMELNHEWIQENIKERKMRFSGPRMLDDQN